MSNKQSAIIVDIDGTAALGIGVHRKAYDYHLCGKDSPNLDVWYMIKLYIQDNKLEDRSVIFLSGRENVSFPGKSNRKDICYRRATFRDKEYSTCYDLTYAWIDYIATVVSDISDIGLNWKLHMREADDYREDSIVKAEMYDKYVKDKYHINFVLDDRNQVVKMWREIGLFCLQVADGNF